MNLSDVNPHIRYARVHHAHLGNVKKTVFVTIAEYFLQKMPKEK